MPQVKNHKEYMEMLDFYVSNYHGNYENHTIGMVNKYGIGAIKRWERWMNARGLFPDNTFELFDDDYTPEGREIGRWLKKISNPEVRNKIMTNYARSRSPLYEAYNYLKEEVLDTIYDTNAALYDSDNWPGVEDVEWLDEDDEYDVNIVEERLTATNLIISYTIHKLEWDEDDGYDEGQLIKEVSVTIPREFEDTGEFIEFMRGNYPDTEIYQSIEYRIFELLYDYFGWTKSLRPVQRDESNDFVWQTKTRDIHPNKMAELRAAAQAEVQENKAMIAQEFAAENVDNALITGSVEGDPAMFLFTKGHKDDTGFTTGRIMVDDDLDEIHDTITDIQEDVGEDRIKTGFKSWKRNVWGLKPYSAESITQRFCPVCDETGLMVQQHSDSVDWSCSACGHQWHDWRAEEFEAVTDEWIVNRKRFNPLSRHYVPKKKEVAAENFNADYCSTCMVKEHPSCPLEEGCRCCENKMRGIYRSKTHGAEDYEAESYREFFEEIEKLMNETAGSDWDLYAQTEDDGTVSLSIEYTPLDPKFFEDYGDEWLPENYDEKESEHMIPKPCSICGQPFTGYGNNPEPVVPISTGQCCDTCNAVIVIPARMRGMGFRADTVVQQRAKSRGLDARLEKSKKKPKDKATGEGVRRNFWKGLFSFKKNAESFEAPEGVCLFCDETEELLPVNLDGWPEEICEGCLFSWDDWDAEQTLKGKVRTMSGKPHKTRKLVKDKDITAEEAATRLKLESPVDAYGLAYNQGFDDARTAKRWSPTGTKKMTYAPDDSYKEDEQLFEDTYKRR